MFTSSRARMWNQRGSSPEQQRGSSPPPPGSDSYYGVRSLNGSVWSDPSIPSSSDEPDHTVSPPDQSRSTSSSDTEVDGESLQAGQGLSGPDMTPTSDWYHELPSSRDDGDLDQNEEGSEVQYSAHVVPPSPDDTLHPLDKEALDRVEDNDNNHHHHSQPQPHTFHSLSLAHLESLADAPSVPSSPASFTSLSYVASLSSLSRTSSPVSGIAYHRHSHPVGVGLGVVEDDLVLPTLSLPSTSLHISLPKYDGAVTGLKIGLVGGREDVQALIRGLEERRHIVDLGKGRVGVMRDGEVVASLITSQTVEQMYLLVEEGYVTLDGLLNPSPPPGKEGEVKKMVADYATRNDWVHLVYTLGSDIGSIKEIVHLSPTMSKADIDPNLFRLPESDHQITPEESRAPTPSPPGLSDDPTPMPSLSRAHSYFAQAAPSRPDPASTVLNTIDASGAVASASVNKFLQWRHAPTSIPNLSHLSTLSTAIDSSLTTSPASSSYGTHAPMPTVARASGGGEWEANLSRRVANAHARKRGSKPRRSIDRIDAERAKQRERERQHGPLFPRASPKLSSVGIREMWTGAFGDGQWLKKRIGWKWGLVAAAVVVAAVGWGYWARTR